MGTTVGRGGRAHVLPSALLSLLSLLLLLRFLHESPSPYLPSRLVHCRWLGTCSIHVSPLEQGPLHGPGHCTVHVDQHNSLLLLIKLD